MKCYIVQSVLNDKESNIIHLPMYTLSEMDLNLDNICAVLSHDMSLYKNLRTLKAEDVETTNGLYFKILPPHSNSFLYFYVTGDKLKEFYNYFDVKERQTEYCMIYYKLNELLYKTSDEIVFKDKSNYRYRHNY
jgi:hypothetical protein